MSSIGIFGGTFDPIHFGHLITALAVKEIRSLDKIIFIPAHISPHKTTFSSSSAAHRLAMINLAINNIEGFEVSDFELNKQGISYTIDTISHYKNIYSHIDLIIGYDNLLNFTTWKDPDEIVKLASLVVLSRKSNQPDVSNPYFNHAELVKTPLIEISSTDIRRRVKENKLINFLVPKKVMEYIYSLNLYKD
jgi:nicotinate-nucleotide adenylyltransferase